MYGPCVDLCDEVTLPFGDLWLDSAAAELVTQTSGIRDSYRYQVSYVKDMASSMFDLEMEAVHLGYGESTEMVHSFSSFCSRYEATSQYPLGPEDEF